MHDTRQPPFLKHAENNGLVKFTGEGKTERIHYIAANHSERWSDKEEKVRAEFWAELIYKYEYRPERIRFEVKVPRRTPSDLADLVIYGDKDEQLKAPYFVFECKSADVSDAEFTQAIEQACGNRANLAASFCGVIAGIRDQIKTPGQNYLSLAHVQSNTGELTTSNEEAAGACSEYQTGDVLFARLRPYLNKVYRAEMDGCCSPEFHVLRVNNAKELLPDYLAAILRSSLTLAQTRHMMTGNTHPRLTNEDVINLVIPIPKDVAAQKTIAAEARRRREDARRLRAEAEAGWQAAKRWFEEQLLGPA